MHVKPHVQTALEYMNKDKSAYNLAFEWQLQLEDLIRLSP